MNNFLRVAANEYKRNVFKKSYVAALLSIPCIIGIILAVGLTVEGRRGNQQPVGVVDLAGILAPEPVTPELLDHWTARFQIPLAMTFFSDEPAARTALHERQIQAFFLLPEAYFQSRHLKVFYLDEPGPGEQVWQQVYDLLRANLVTGLPTPAAQRAAFGMDFVVRSIDGLRQIPESSGPTFGLIMPLFIALAFLFMLLASAGYTADALTEEKENRTLEVLVTSISPLQLVGGKILGIVATSLTLLFTWMSVVLLGIWVSRAAGVGWFSDMSMDWRPVISLVAIGLPAYLLSIAAMTTLSAMLATTRQSGSVGTLFLVLHMAPLYVSILFLTDPHHPLAIVLSLLPFTSLMTVAMRNLFTIVPAWQVGLSVAVQLLCAICVTFLAGRAFRLGMLRFGQRLSLRHLLGRA